MKRKKKLARLVEVTPEMLRVLRSVPYDSPKVIGPGPVRARLLRLALVEKNPAGPDYRVTDAGAQVVEQLRIGIAGTVYTSVDVEGPPAARAR